MRAMGVTCAEIKTGYGLDTRTELKQISVVDQLKKAQKMRIVGTFMGLHAVPRGMNADEYTDECIRESLPAAAGTGVCEFADAFVERGAFSAEQAKRYFLKAKQLGFSLKVHADEMTPSGGTRLGVELGAKSADHLLKILDEDIALLAKSQTVATVLPLTAFCLGEEYAPARRLIDGGAIVAAACAGIVCGKAEKQLEVISQVSEEQTQQLKQYLAQTPVSVRLADTPYIFDIDVRLGGQGHTSRVRIVEYHTNIVLEEKDGKKLLEKEIAGILGYDMYCSGNQFYGGDGIVKKGVENTIRSVGRLAHDGMAETDKEIIDIMLNG